MPMTAAHPLAVLPLRRTSLDWTCLVIGSMSPDFEYFLRVKLASSISHTWLGLLVFCLPVTLASAWLFHRLIKRPFVHVVPAGIGARLAASADRPWQLTWGCVAAALVGAVTHDLWDGLTHYEMWGPQHIAWLREIVHVPGLGAMVRCRVLQHGSTVIGLLALAIFTWRALARMQPQPRAPATLGMRIVWIACIAVVGVACYARIHWSHETDPGSIVVAVIDAGLFGSLLASLITR
ncbi:MAG: DUF4184 family protein [Deltaproteobacteria bacterium]|nr:DUF4184 family protein [Deltaproteobacteria bacterium]